MTISGRPQPLITPRPAAPSLQLVEPGLVDYRQAWELQRELHAQRRASERDDTVILLQHPSVYTAGKRTAPKDRPQDDTPVVEVDRGGLITWHGPGQLVGYPIIELPRPLDVVAYIRRMEGMLIDVCARLGLATIRIEGRTGVWVPGDGTGPDRKVAAIGVRVSFRITLHGFALNCNPDLAAFDKIVPCGLDDAAATSLSAELGRPVTVDEVLPLVRPRLEMLRNVPSPTA
ncbi:MAG TPA: lipoyl(octanoyl) transferase LipB [Mycobacteriales bacterium]|jgi:lipoyl(octanoyl) transferase|nr:lipoyl(octanoyl) transferase LipB [Mycobacteriales bacterium]